MPSSLVRLVQHLKLTDHLKVDYFSIGLSIYLRWICIHRSQHWKLLLLIRRIKTIEMLGIVSLSFQQLHKRLFQSKANVSFHNWKKNIYISSISISKLTYPKWIQSQVILRTFLLYLWCQLDSRPIYLPHTEV